MENKTNVIEDIVEYANRYGYAALGYAIKDMVENNELNMTEAECEGVWEYGGYAGN